LSLWRTRSTRPSRALCRFLRRDAKLDDVKKIVQALLKLRMRTGVKTRRGPTRYHYLAREP